MVVLASGSMERRKKRNIGKEVQGKEVEKKGNVCIGLLFLAEDKLLSSSTKSLSN